MTYQPTAICDDVDTIPRMPSWVTATRTETLEDMAFLSGAALSYLHLVHAHPAVPQSLLRARLVLRAAEACVVHSGGVERAGDLRDAWAFLQPGDHPGPAGALYLSWQRAVARPVSATALHRALPQIDPDHVAQWLQIGRGGAVACAALVLGAVLKGHPRDHMAALLLADATLAAALGWTHLVPLCGFALKRADLRKTGGDLQMACHRAVTAAAIEVTRLATDLSRRASQLSAIAPKLRAKGSGEAVALFLQQDALAPSALTSLCSDRAARRFCDRLVALGAARELTGRDTFRLYGV